MCTVCGVCTRMCTQAHACVWCWELNQGSEYLRHSTTTKLYFTAPNFMVIVVKKSVEGEKQDTPFLSQSVSLTL